MTSWLPRAQQLADDINEPGFGAAVTFASAVNARLDVAAYAPLYGAAMALTAGEALGRLYDKATPPMDEDTTLHRSCANLEADLFELGKRAREMNDDCLADFEEADGRYGKAVKAYKAAEARRAAASDETEVNAAQAEMDAARADADAQRRICADCEAALEVIARVIETVDYAIACVRQVRPAFEVTYESALALVRSWAGDGQQHRLPYDGDFLTGADPDDVHVPGWTAV